MGLIGALLGLPLAPVRGVVWIAERVVEQAEAQFYDEDEILRALAKAEMDNQLGHISDEEYEDLETYLLERLEQARAYKQAQVVEAEMIERGEDRDA
jgi:Gas vesicle protein G